MIVNLNQTVDWMRSEDYRDRFRAEYWQLRIRTKRLGDLLTAIKAAQLMDEPEPPHDVPQYVLQEQYRQMRCYLETLELRAACEKIELGGGYE